MAYINGEEVLFSPQIHINEGGTEGALLLNAEEKQTVQGEVGFKRDVTIEGNLEVLGEFTKTNVDSLVVKDRFIVCNDGESKLTSGIVIKTGESYTNESTTFYPAYGIILDPDTEIVRLGRGYVTEERGSDIEYEQYIPEFHFGKIVFEDLFDGNVDIIITPEEGQAISTRSDSIPNGNLVKWDAEENKMVDAQTSLNMFTPNRLVQGGHFLYINKSGAHSNSYWDKMSGIVIPISGEYHGADNVCQDAYAIVFDHKTKTLRLGTGQIIHSKNIYTGEGEIDYSYFEFGGYLHENGTEDEAIATRADDFTEGHIPQWDSERNMFVDSGKSIDNIGGGSSADIENIREQIVYLYSRTDDISSSLGDISTALDEILELQDFYTGATFDELHEYAQAVKEGE